MTKREIRKEAYKRIIKENQSHQAAYDEMFEKSPSDGNLIAEELSKYPDEKKRLAKKNLVVTYVVLLAVIILLRILAFFVTPEILRLPPVALLFVLVLTMVVPVVGIVMALMHKTDGYRTLAMLFVLSIIRALKYLTGDPWEFIGFVPVGAAIILAFVIPGQLKVPFKKHLIKPAEGSGGKMTTRIVFDETSGVPASDELLDNKI